MVRVVVVGLLLLVLMELVRAVELVVKVTL
jgi:hypothetical protein